MIAKALPMKAPQKSHFGQLVKYLVRDDPSILRSGQVTVTNCYQDEISDVILEVLNTQRQNTRTLSDKTYHLLLSFRSGEVPNDDTLQAIEAAICADLGFAEHQRISAVHQDTDNLHVHIAINKVHPRKLTIHHPYQDYKVLATCCQKLEQTYKLASDNHTPQRTTGAGRARDMEHHAGIESLIGWIQQHVLDRLLPANSWADCHHVLRESGLRFHVRGNGLCISTEDGALSVKASSVARPLSKAQLESRFGTFQPAQVQELSQFPVKQSYERLPLNTGAMDTTALYKTYQAAMQKGTVIRNEKLTQIRKQQRAQIQYLKNKAAHQRRWIKALIKPGINKKLLLTLIGKNLQADIQRLHADNRQHRGQLIVQYRRQTWVDWLQQQAMQGNKNALYVLRQRQVKAECQGNSVSGRPSIPNEGSNDVGELTWLKTKITNKGTVFYSQGRGVIKDSGQYLQLDSNADQSVLITALIVAKQRYGTTLSLQGDDHFKDNVVRAAVKASLVVYFEPPEWEKRRMQLNVEQRLFGDSVLKQQSPVQQPGRHR